MHESDAVSVNRIVAKPVCRQELGGVRMPEELEGDEAAAHLEGLLSENRAGSPVSDLWSRERTR